jgi:hypothetical protein
MLNDDDDDDECGAMGGMYGSCSICRLSGKIEYIMDCQSILQLEEWCLLGCYAVKTSNLTILQLVVYF